MNRPSIAININEPHLKEQGAMGRVVASTFIGGAIEWYDFAIFGFLSALVFNKIFFSDLSPAIGTIAALGTFALGFVARPLGGIVFGHFGDRIGRKSMLILTLIMMGISSLLIGFLPSYESIGILSPALLVFLRFVQGFSLGGEWGGAALLLVEHAQPTRRGVFGALGASGAAIGQLFGALLITGLASALSTENLISWGWRIPFLINVLLVGVGLYIRIKVPETPVFTRIRKQKTQSRFPLAFVIRKQWRNVILIGAMHAANTYLFYLVFVFAISYTTHSVHINRKDVLLGADIALLILIPICVMAGALSDRFGRRRIYLIGTIGSVLIAFPFFSFLNTGSIGQVWFAFVVGAALTGFMFPIQPAYFSELFATEGRYTGMSLGLQGATVLVGSTAPILGSLLLKWSEGHTWTISVYTIIIGLISTIAAIIAGETTHVDLNDVQLSGDR